MRYGQLVIGAAGSGKSTYCRLMTDYLQYSYRRRCSIINMDPAVDSLEYDCLVDVRDIIKYEEVMIKQGLGPNGGLMYCMEYICDNIEKVCDEINKNTCDEADDEYIFLDCPGQIELYTHVDVMKNTVRNMMSMCNMNVCCVFLIDSMYFTEPQKIISVLLVSLTAMIALELPHVNVISKGDLIYEKTLIGLPPVYRPTKKTFKSNENFDDTEENNVKGSALGASLLSTDTVCQVDHDNDFPKKKDSQTDRLDSGVAKCLMNSDKKISRHVSFNDTPVINTFDRSDYCAVQQSDCSENLFRVSPNCSKKSVSHYGIPFCNQKFSSADSRTGTTESSFSSSLLINHKKGMNNYSPTSSEEESSSDDGLKSFTNYSFSTHCNRFLNNSTSIADYNNSDEEELDRLELAKFRELQQRISSDNNPSNVPSKNSKDNGDENNSNKIPDVRTNKTSNKPNFPEKDADSYPQKIISSDMMGPSENDSDHFPIKIRVYDFVKGRHETQDLLLLLNRSMSERYSSLNESIVNIISDYNLLGISNILNYRKTESLNKCIHIIDQAIQYGENAEPMTKDNESDYVTDNIVDNLTGNATF